MSFEYSVAIRTLGKGGEKYRQELLSLHAQTVPPKRIFIFLAEGFERPSFQVGIEEYISVHKGLVHQRAASTDGVETEFLLILDDDVYLPPEAVERMHEAMQQQQADGVVPDTFPTHTYPWTQKAQALITNCVCPRKNDGWGIKIMRNGTFSYNNSPEQGAFYPTQSAAGPALFVKTDAFKAIRYQDEYWVDQFPAGSLGEDQIMFYKLFKNGYKILLQYDSGILHLDAGTNNASQKTYEKLYYRAMAQYLIWYRCRMGDKQMSARERWLCRGAYGIRFLVGGLTRLFFSIAKCSPRFIVAHIKGNLAAARFVQSEHYRSIPPLKIQ